MNAGILIPILTVVFANVLYHVASKGIPTNQNAFMGLIVNYATALIACIALFIATPHNSAFGEFTKSNWAAVVMGLSITAVELGFLYIYRNGGEISTASLIASILLALIMLPVGIFFYGEALTATKIIGALLCIAGIIVISI